MCTLALESTTNSLSSWFLVDAAGIIHSSSGEQNVALSELKIFLARFNALPQAHRSCLALSSGDLSSNFTAWRLRCWGLLTCILPSFPDVCVTQCSPVNRSRRIGPKTCVPFREIAADSSGSTSCDTQPNCRTLVTTTTALLWSPFFGFLHGYSSTFQCGKEHSAPNLHPDLVL